MKIVWMKRVHVSFNRDKGWIRVLFFGLGVWVLSAAPPASAQEVPGEPSGREIAVMVDEREDGDDQISEAVWTLTNSKGKTRKRDTLRYWGL